MISKRLQRNLAQVAVQGQLDVAARRFPCGRCQAGNDVIARQLRTVTILHAGGNIPHCIAHRVERRPAHQFVVVIQAFAVLALRQNRSVPVEHFSRIGELPAAGQMLVIRLEGPVPALHHEGCQKDHQPYEKSAGQKE